MNLLDCENTYVERCVFGIIAPDAFFRIAMVFSTADVETLITGTVQDDIAGENVVNRHRDSRCRLCQFFFALYPRFDFEL